MSDILAAEPAGKNNIGCVCGVGGHREGKMAQGGKDGVAERPRIEPPINKSKSYLNTLPPPLGFWVSGIRLHLSSP